MKRLFDLLASGFGLLALSPVLVMVCVAIWVEDRHGPFYIGRRVAQGGGSFPMIKFRSMTPRADKSGVDSTAASDPRITRVGHVIRKLKLDEFSQLMNVFRGDMSLVGPRPQVERDVALYTDVERGLLAARPGITDFSSIVFADEGEILRGADDPDLRYQQLIRPWKSRMGLHYVAARTFWLDLRLILATLLNAASRERALAWVASMLQETGAEPEVVRVARRQEALVPTPPPVLTRSLRRVELERVVQASQELMELAHLAADIRRSSLEMISRARSSHIGSVYSAVEILAVLYGGVLRLRPDEPDWADRDRFILSKGHACAGLYAVLAHRGFFPLARLEEFYVDGGSLAGHATHKGVPGVEVSTGSLGHGLGLAVGFAAGARRKGLAWRVFTLLSDGECDEGSTWEAALLAPQLGVGNLTALIDFNKIQSLGRVDEVIPLEPFADKWRAFGWNVMEVDGHDLAALMEVLNDRPGGEAAAGVKPLCVIAHTVKGKGVSFMEDDLLWHYRSPQNEELEAARAELEANDPRAPGATGEVG